MKNSESAPVLVVGAGSTGLMMACELARHGAPVRIVDRLPGVAPFARATGVHSRTLEIFQDLGIVDEIVARSALIRGANQYAGGELMLHFRSDGLDSPFPYSASLEQWKVEETLENLLNRLGVAVERETEFIALEEDEHAVRATLRRADDATETVETPWLIGCDGAHSQVRHLKGEHFPGEVDPRQYLVADVVLEHVERSWGERPWDEVYIYLTDGGALWWFPLPEGRTLLAADVPQQHDACVETPELADVQTLLDERSPGRIRVRDPRWLSWFHIHYRMTPHYRHGRTFLAGDAAHIHSPIGGQGMNTGIQDAYNLAWKLALVVRGRASRSLLDSYEIERHAVARDVLETTRALTEKAERYVTVPPGERAQLYRHVVLPDAERMNMLRHNEELDLDYRRSPICCEGIGAPSAERPASGAPHAGAEARDAHPLVVDGKMHTLFELLRGTQHTLLLLPGLEPAQRGDPAALSGLAAEASRWFGERLRTLAIMPPDLEAAPFAPEPALRVRDIEGALHRRYGAAAGRVYLIRPDGYVGFRGPPRPAALHDYLETLLELPGAGAET